MTRGRCVFAALYLGFFAYWANDIYRHPLMTWDMIAYMGVVESYYNGDPQALYDKTMARVKYIFTPHTYRGFSEENPLSNNATAFYQQLPFYSVKVLYTGGIYLMHQLGMRIPLAAHLIPIAGFIAIGLLCLYFRPAALHAGVWWALIAWFITTLPSSLIYTAALATPDTLCIALCIAGVCAWAYKRSRWGFGICMLLAQLARPDTLMMTLCLLAYFFWMAPTAYRMRLRDGLIIGIVVIEAYLYVAYLTHYYGWKTHFYYHFIQRSAYPATTPADFTFAQYWEITLYGLQQMLANARVFWLLCASGLATAGYIYRPGNNGFWLGLLWMTWVSLLLRFLMFPAWTEYRLYYPSYFIILFALAELLGPYVSGAWQHLSQKRSPASP